MVKIVWDDFEKCKKEALKYKNISDFKTIASGCYKSCKRNNWIKNIRLLFNNIQKPNNYWSFEKCAEEAKKYSTRTEFKTNSSGAYGASVRNKYLNEICSHMKILGNRNIRVVYIFKFEDNHVYVGLTYNHEERYNGHMKKGTVYKHINKTKSGFTFELISDYINVEDAKKLEIETIKKFKSDGYILLNVKNGGEIGGNIKYWNYDKCKEVALKYNKLTDFINNEKSCYVISLRNKWLYDIINHMVINKQHKKGYWTYDLCKEESLKYETRKKFKINCGTAYEKSRINKWLDDFFFK